MSGTFELTGAYDEDNGEFLGADGEQAFVVHDDHGLKSLSSISLVVSDERLHAVWRAMGEAERMAAEYGLPTTYVCLPMGGIVAEPEDEYYGRYETVRAYADEAYFASPDKHSNVVIETRAIPLAEIEDHLVEAGLISEADRRSEPEAAAPGPR